MANQKTFVRSNAARLIKLNAKGLPTIHIFPGDNIIENNLTPYLNSKSSKAIASKYFSKIGEKDADVAQANDFAERAKKLSEQNKLLKKQQIEAESSSSRTIKALQEKIEVLESKVSGMKT